VTEPFTPTHAVPVEGLPAWSEPDPTQSPVALLDPGLEVRRVEQSENGWARVVCSNEWGAWVDGRRLVALDQVAVPEVVPILDGALGQYGQLVDDLAAQRIDDETFRREAFKIGLVVRERDAWILDLASKRWWRYDGIQLTTLALPAPQATATGGEREWPT
jgi:hypothetical protein